MKKIIFIKQLKQHIFYKTVKKLLLYFKYFFKLFLNKYY